MNILLERLQKHKRLTWTVLLAYIIFNGCFVFPFSNELFPFHYSKGYIIIFGYGIIGMCFSWLLKKGRSFFVLILTWLFTVIGLICRYLIEYGEYSNTINFIPINIILYLIIVPLYCALVYWSIYKWSCK